MKDSDFKSFTWREVKHKFTSPSNKSHINTVSFHSNNNINNDSTNREFTTSKHIFKIKSMRKILYEDLKRIQQEKEDNRITYKRIFDNKEIQTLLSSCSSSNLDKRSKNSSVTPKIRYNFIKKYYCNIPDFHSEKGKENPKLKINRELTNLLFSNNPIIQNFINKKKNIQSAKREPNTGNTGNSETSRINNSKLNSPIEKYKLNTPVVNNIYRGNGNQSPIADTLSLESTSFPIIHKAIRPLSQKLEDEKKVNVDVLSKIISEENKTSEDDNDNKLLDKFFSSNGNNEFDNKARTYTKFFNQYPTNIKDKKGNLFIQKNDMKLNLQAAPLNPNSFKIHEKFNSTSSFFHPKKVTGQAKKLKRSNSSIIHNKKLDLNLTNQVAPDNYYFAHLKNMSIFSDVSKISKARPFHYDFITKQKVTKKFLDSQKDRDLFPFENLVDLYSFQNNYKNLGNRVDLEKIQYKNYEVRQHLNNYN